MSFENTLLVRSAPQSWDVPIQCAMNATEASSSKNCCEGIIPPHIFEKAIEYYSEKRPHVAERLREQLEEFRSRRTHQDLLNLDPLGIHSHIDPKLGNQVYKAGGALHKQIPGSLARSEKGKKTKASTSGKVNAAFDAIHHSEEFHLKVYDVKFQGPPVSTVDYGIKYNNAFWNGEQMVYGNGDPRMFRPFVLDEGVPFHELEHAFTQMYAGSSHGTATGLNYQGDSGGMNESFSDFFAALLRQYLHQGEEIVSPWKIGTNLIVSKHEGDALRDMLNPGTAYINHKILGTDPQGPYVKYRNWEAKAQDEDPHMTSAVANYVFSHASVEGGGEQPWETIGKIAVEARTYVKPDVRYPAFADLTITIAERRFGKDKEWNALNKYWKETEVLL